MARYRICVVGPYAGSMLFERWSQQYAGGAEMQQVLLARELARRGHDVSFVIQEADGPEKCEVDGITVYRYAPVRVFSGVNAGIKCQRLWRTLMRIRPEIIYQRMADWQTGVCAAAARSIGAIFIHAVASDRDVADDRGMNGNVWQRWMYHWGLARAALILAQHTQQVAFLRANYGLEARLFPSVYLSTSKVRRTERDGVCWVGMFSEGKRPAMLMELARRVPESRFMLIGGPGADQQGAAIRNRLAAEARGLANVHLLGFLNPLDVDRRLGEAMVLVNTSPGCGEGLPVTYLQAWRQATPTIGFSSAGRDEILQSCGWSVRNLDELAALLRRLKQDPDLARARGRQARKYFEEHHAADVVIPQFEDLMGEVVERISRCSALGHRRKMRGA